MRFFYILFICSIASCTPSKRVANQTVSTPLQEIIADYESYENSEDEKPHWPDLSDTTRQRYKKHTLSLQERLSGLDRDRLSAEEQINCDMLALILDHEAYQAEFQNYLMPLNAEGGFLTSIVYTIRGVRIQDDEAYDAYIEKLRALPSYFDDRIEDMKQGIQENKISPKVIVHNCIRLIDIYLESEESIFIAPIKKSSYQRYDADQIIQDDIKPAYTKLRDFLQNKYLPAAKEKVGISEVTDGKAYYEHLVRYFTTLEMTPDEVYQTGEREVARIKSEMMAIIERLAYKGSYAEFLEFLRTDPQFYVKTGEELLEKASWIAKQMENEMPKYFGKLPRMPFSVKPVPDALAPTYTTGRYSGGSYKNNRAGQYWVNTYKLESRPLYVLPSLTLHEAVPGHHHQIMLAKEIEGLPDFRKTYISAFGEGWGLYSEYLGKEVGMYKTDYEDFGRLTYEMWRACRLVVDVGMHYKGWSRQDALDFMAENTALSIHEVTTEIDRYIGWPAQAVSYKIGELKIRALRSFAEEELGDRFDIKVFHDTILENGSVPLYTLERIIKNFVEQEKQRT